MPVILDHVFILVEPKAKVADRLIEHGFREGPRNTHPGQGTANRRFYFANGMLEFLWVQNAVEARRGPGQDLYFAERSQDPTASPFGIIFVPDKDDASPHMPFPGWHYQPVYFPAPIGFHVGANSHNIAEPLCFHFPFHDPGVPKPQPHRNPHTVSEVVLTTPSTDTEGVLALASHVDRLSIRSGNKHLMEITLDHHKSRRTEDYQPSIPLILHW